MYVRRVRSALDVTLTGNGESVRAILQDFERNLSISHMRNNSKPTVQNREYLSRHNNTTINYTRY